MRRQLLAAIGLVASTLLSCDFGTTFSWIALAPVQCEIPWNGHPAGGWIGGAAERESALAFYAAEGLPLEEIGFAGRPVTVCTACGCSRGDLLIARAPADSAWSATRELGFHYLATSTAARWLSISPVQCGGNPWEQVSALGGEREKLVAWAASLGVSVDYVAFVHPSVAAGVCLACSCPRGDRVVVSVNDPQDEEVLRANGFSGLFE
jgi:hypothetical protein